MWLSAIVAVGSKADQKSGFSHASAASTSVRMPLIRWNRMKPGIHAALT